MLKFIFSHGTWYADSAISGWVWTIVLREEDGRFIVVDMPYSKVFLMFDEAVKFCEQQESSYISNKQRRIFKLSSKGIWKTPKINYEYFTIKIDNCGIFTTYFCHSTSGNNITLGKFKTFEEAKAACETHTFK